MREASAISAFFDVKPARSVWKGESFQRWEFFAETSQDTSERERNFLVKGWIRGGRWRKVKIFSWNHAPDRHIWTDSGPIWKIIRQCLPTSSSTDRASSRSDNRCRRSCAFYVLPGPQEDAHRDRGSGSRGWDDDNSYNCNRISFNMCISWNESWRISQLRISHVIKAHKRRTAYQMNAHRPLDLKRWCQLVARQPFLRSFAKRFTLIWTIQTKNSHLHVTKSDSLEFESLKENTWLTRSRESSLEIQIAPIAI